MQQKFSDSAEFWRPNYDYINNNSFNPIITNSSENVGDVLKVKFVLKNDAYVTSEPVDTVINFDSAEKVNKGRKKRKKGNKKPIQIQTQSQSQASGQGGSHDEGYSDDYSHKHHFKRRGCKGGHHKHGGGKMKHMKKYVLPMIIGIITAKSILLPILLKALTFLAAKGAFLGLVATILSSIIGLKKLVSHERSDKEPVTKVEIIPVHLKGGHHRRHINQIDRRIDVDITTPYPYRYYYNN